MLYTANTICWQCYFPTYPCLTSYLFIVLYVVVVHKEVCGGGMVVVVIVKSDGCIDSRSNSVVDHGSK